MRPFPTPPRRAWLQAFALVVGLGAGTLLAAALWLAGARPGALAGLGLGTLLAAAGLLHPPLVRAPYDAWVRVSRQYLRFARLVIKALGFLVVVAAGKAARDALRLAPPDGPRSLWVPRGQANASAFGTAWRGAAPAYVAWARETGKWWAVALLPFLLLLATVDTETEPTPPTQTYTLF